MDNLTSLLHAYGNAAPNDEVKSKILELVQVWESGTRGRSDASYIAETYRRLQSERFAFPPKVEMSSSMLDSSAVSNPGIFPTNLLIWQSRRNGSIRMFVCAAEPPLASRIESTIVEIVETYLMGNAQLTRYRCLIWASCKQ